MLAKPNNHIILPITTATQPQIPPTSVTPPLCVLLSGNLFFLFRAEKCKKMTSKEMMPGGLDGPNRGDAGDYQKITGAECRETREAFNVEGKW